jgi:hypothetical protein
LEEKLSLGESESAKLNDYFLIAVPIKKILEKIKDENPEDEIARYITECREKTFETPSLLDIFDEEIVDKIVPLLCHQHYYDCLSKIYDGNLEKIKKGFYKYHQKNHTFLRGTRNLIKWHSKVGTTNTHFRIDSLTSSICTFYVKLNYFMKDVLSTILKLFNDLDNDKNIRLSLM